MRTRYGDSLVIVAWLPYGERDTLSINPDDSLRLSRYQHNIGQPALALDGYLQVAMPSASEFYETFDAAIRSVKSTAAYVALTATGEADTLEGRVIITLAMDSITPGSSPTLYCVVTEDSLSDRLGPPWYRVPRTFVPDRNGIPVSLARGDTLVDTLTFATAGHRLDKLGAAVFVEDASGTEEHRVLQSATISRFVLTEDR